MGVGASMLWWGEGLCRTLADGGRFVIPYDHRDTGRSVAYAPGRPEYADADLVADAVGVLDSYGVPAAHLVGVSASRAFAQLLALDFADRVLLLVLISTTRALSGERELPPPTEKFVRSVTTAEVDWAEAESVIEYLIAYSWEASAHSLTRQAASSSAARSSGRTTSPPRRTTMPSGMTSA